MSHVKKQMISFFLTTDCNLRCVYCYNSNERKKQQTQTLSLEFAKKGLEYFFKHNPSRHIRFYGPGEPTQKFDLMKEITEYAHKLAGDDLVVELQTNGAFGKRVREWICQNVDIVWISFDGPPDIQNANRPFPNNKPSAGIIEENVKYLLEHRKKMDGVIGARITISEKNINRQKEMIDYFEKLGITYMWTDPLFPEVTDIPVCKDVNRKGSQLLNMNEYADRYIEAYYYAKEKGVFYGSFLACNFDGCSQYHCRACTPVPHLTPDGYVSACDMVTFGEKAHHMEVFVIGKWEEKKKEIVFYPERIDALQKRKTSNMPHCKDCSVADHCGGYCLGEVVNETGSLYGQKTLHCVAIKKIAKEIGFSNYPYKYLHP